MDRATACWPSCRATSKDRPLADGIAPPCSARSTTGPSSAATRGLSLALNAGRAEEAFDLPANCMAPLPRASSGSTAPPTRSTSELLMRARGAKLPDNLWRAAHVPPGGSDDFLRALRRRAFEEEHWDIDFEPELAVVLGDTPMHVRRDEAL